jgi:hypothetical protein
MPMMALNPILLFRLIEVSEADDLGFSDDSSALLVLSKAFQTY